MSCRGSTGPLGDLENQLRVCLYCDDVYRDHVYRDHVVVSPHRSTEAPRTASLAACGRAGRSAAIPSFGNLLDGRQSFVHGVHPRK